MEIRNAWRAVKPFVPSKARPFIYKTFNRTYKQFLYHYTDFQDQWHIKHTGFTSLPPSSLRERVHGALDVDSFLKVGKQCSQDIENSLVKTGKSLDSLQNVLDFGCGCGRTLIWFANRSQSLRLHGTDTDANAVSWCRSNLNFARFSVNKSLPPLEYPSAMFDLIYAISVFTHLDEDYQFRWLEELKRVTRPKGTVLVTVHGRHSLNGFSPQQVSDIERTGFMFVSSDYWKGTFPEWYQTSFHTKEYILDKYSKYFDVLDYIPGGMNNHQDMVVLQKP